MPFHSVPAPQTPVRSGQNNRRTSAPRGPTWDGPGGLDLIGPDRDPGSSSGSDPRQTETFEFLSSPSPLAPA